MQRRYMNKLFVRSAPTSAADLWAGVSL